MIIKNRLEKGGQNGILKGILESNSVTNRKKCNESYLFQLEFSCIVVIPLVVILQNYNLKYAVNPHMNIFKAAADYSILPYGIGQNGISQQTYFTNTVGSLPVNYFKPTHTQSIEP